MDRRGRSYGAHGRAQSTVSPELGHNREYNQRHRAVRTLALAAGRRQVASERPLELGAVGWERIEASRNGGCSPELIAGRRESFGNNAQRPSGRASSDARSSDTSADIGVPVRQ